jgi:hypothetical protein
MKAQIITPCQDELATNLFVRALGIIQACLN